MKITTCIGSTCHIKGSRRVVDELSIVVYTGVGADAISFEANGCIIMNVEKYDLIFDQGE